MNPWRSFEKWGFTIAVAGALALSGCYSGWNRPRGAGDGPDPSKPVPPVKPIGLAVIDVISMTSQALGNRGCSDVPVSLVDLRLSEEAARLKLLMEALRNAAEIVSIRKVAVKEEDCRTMTAIEQAAASAEVPGLESLTSDIKAKPAVHIRLVYWLGDFSYHWASEAVVRPDWALMTTLKTAGFQRRLSVNDFVLTPRFYSGYVGSWSIRAPSELSYFPPTVSAVTPDQEGVKTLMQSAQSGTQSFLTWLLEKVSQI